MKRYAVFKGEFFYPSGGWDDFAGTYETLKEAVRAADEGAADNTWAHVVDLQAGTIVYKQK
jgi:hypothetical protein